MGFSLLFFLLFNLCVEVGEGRGGNRKAKYCLFYCNAAKLFTLLRGLLFRFTVALHFNELFPCSVSTGQACLVTHHMLSSLTVIRHETTQRPQQLFLPLFRSHSLSPSFLSLLLKSFCCLRSSASAPLLSPLSSAPLTSQVEMNQNQELAT